MTTSIYKYLRLEYAQRLVDDGEALFRSLLYFQACEDARTDESEGIRPFEPVGGLHLRKHTQGTRIVLPGSFNAAIRRPHELFAFCTSRLLTETVAAKFETDACVEIRDVNQFSRRLRTAVRRIPQAKLGTLRHGTVNYYDTAAPPETAWALPELIAMAKRRRFDDEVEYRFAFSLDRDAFKFEGAALTLATGLPARVPPGHYPQLLLRLGNLSHVAAIHRF